MEIVIMIVSCVFGVAMFFGILLGVLEKSWKDGVQAFFVCWAIMFVATFVGGLAFCVYLMLSALVVVLA